MSTTPPCILVIFGASGDLARRKLIPAIYGLAREKLLPDQFAFMGFARTAMSDAQYREDCARSLADFAKVPADDPTAQWLLERASYMSADDYGDDVSYKRLADRLRELDQKLGTAGNRLFYLSTPPGQFRPIIECLGQTLYCGANRPFQRIVIEKPFGFDLASAKELNALLHRYFDEEQVFRIDHFLGKETVQNLMVMRFANSVFEPIWNYKYIDHVQITVSETLGVGSRGGYYDKSGALRDMVQNHLFQLMALVAMEPPVSLDAQSVRDEKVKVYRSIRPYRPPQVQSLTVRGQYSSGQIGEKRTDGYLKEKDVPADSRTETFVALKVFIDNWRWSGMPFYLRTGKCLPEKLSEIAVRFRSPPQTLFQKQCQAPVFPNDLIIRVQPEEGISWRLNGKVPGGQMNIQSVALDFAYKTAFHAQPPDAYERLLQDAILGEQTLFIRHDEVEAAWSVVDPIEQAWHGSDSRPEAYAPGSWGPSQAQALIELDGRRWLHSAGGEVEPIIACSL
jgi:glucose-6-phosphate 1-dehydrogenase